MSAPFLKNLGQLSHSSCCTLHACPRKYELEKYSETKRGWGEVHLDYGQVVGVGVQEYLVRRNLNDAKIKMFAMWKDDLDGADDSIFSERDNKNKTFWSALHAIDRFVPIAEEELGLWEVATLNGRPATELGFSIDLGSGIFYRGFIDVVLIHRMNRRLLVIENKTTGFNRVHEAQFKNSGQALGYSLVLDKLQQLLDLGDTSSYHVCYPVYKTTGFSWEFLVFKKNHTMRTMWLRNILVDKAQLLGYVNDEYFPMRGESCYNFMRPCDFFGMCELSNDVLYPKGFVEREEREGKYDYHFSITELIDAQMRSLDQ